MKEFFNRNGAHQGENIIEWCWRVDMAGASTLKKLSIVGGVLAAILIPAFWFFV